MPIDLPKQYDPQAAQEKWYPFWERAGFFNADSNESKLPHTIMIPLPNVTGALHMGHALNGTVQDLITRWRRMQGYEALWMPGTDHAGIATQSVVERRMLEEEGKTRHDVGRDTGADEGMRAQMALEEGMADRRVAGRHGTELRIPASGEEFFAQYVAVVGEDVLLAMAAVPGARAVEVQPGLPFARWLEGLGGKTHQTAGPDKGDVALLQGELLEDGKRLSTALERRHEGPAADALAELRIGKRFVPARRRDEASAVEGEDGWLESGTRGVVRVSRTHGCKSLMVCHNRARRMLIRSAPAA